MTNTTDPASILEAANKLTSAFLDTNKAIEGHTGKAHAAKAKYLAQVYEFGLEWKGTDALADLMQRRQIKVQPEANYWLYILRALCGQEDKEKRVKVLGISEDVPKWTHDKSWQNDAGVLRYFSDSDIKPSDVAGTIEGFDKRIEGIRQADRKNHPAAPRSAPKATHIERAKKEAAQDIVFPAPSPVEDGLVLAVVEVVDGQCHLLHLVNNSAVDAEQKLAIIGRASIATELGGK